MDGTEQRDRLPSRPVVIHIEQDRCVSPFTVELSIVTVEGTMCVLCDAALLKEAVAKLEIRG